MTFNKCIEWNKGKTKDGYGQIYINGKIMYAHRWAWEQINGPIPKGMCICHKCDNPSCINLRHLFIGSRADNNADTARKGRSCRGEKNGSAKLKPEDIIQIRKMLAKGTTLVSLGQKFGVHRQTISDIKYGKHWAWM